MLARLRQLILEAVPSLAEEWKWETPVWSHNGNVVAAGVFKDHVKLNFFRGASLQDPHGLFNAGLEAKATRAIDFHEGDTIDEPALQELVRAAVAQNGSKKARRESTSGRSLKQARAQPKARLPSGLIVEFTYSQELRGSSNLVIRSGTVSSFALDNSQRWSIAVIGRRGAVAAPAMRAMTEHWCSEPHCNRRGRGNRAPTQRR